MESLEHINAITLVFAALCIFAIAYRVYGIFLANKVLKLDAGRITPAVRFADGHDYVKTNEFVLYGHHFAAIAAAGPLVGPVLAAQFGYLPGALWWCCSPPCGTRARAFRPSPSARSAPLRVPWRASPCCVFLF